MTRTVDIVFDDVKVVALGKLQQTERGTLRDAVARGVLNERSGDEEPWTMGLRHAFQPLQVGPGSGPRHASDGGAEHPHVAEGLVVPRVVDEHHVVGPEQIASHEVDRTADSVGEQNPIHGRVDAEFLQSAHHVLAQRGESARIAVAAENAADPPAGDVAHGAIQSARLQPFRGQPAATGNVPEAKLASLPANQPENVRGLVEPQPSFDRRLGLHRPADEEAGSVPRLNVSGRHEPVVGLHHRELADVVVRGELPDRGQAGFGPEVPPVHQTLDSPYDLVRERVGPRGIDVNHHVASPAPRPGLHEDADSRQRGCNPNDSVECRLEVVTAMSIHSSEPPARMA